jgi:hypothetical protein
MNTRIDLDSTHRNDLMGRIQRTVAAGVLVFLSIAWPTQAGPVHPASNRPPDLPSPVCDSVNVPTGHRVSFHVYALGVQVYRWDGSAWEFVAPVAALYADPGYHGQVGTHFAGPTWEANDGSHVVAARDAGCAPFAGTIPWLLLRAISTSDRGVFAGVAYIQRVNTIGGTAPAVAGAVVGEEAQVPYTAEYYFYGAIRH